MNTQNFYWYALCALRKIMCWLPHKTAVRLGDFLGRIVWLASKHRVDKAETRCVRALGVGVTTARRIVLGSYRNIGRTIAEVLRLPLIAKKLDTYFKIQGGERIEEALKSGKGVILLLGHLDNWETAIVYSLGRFPFNAIAADQRDPRITELLIQLRGEAGARSIRKQAGLKAALACLRRGECLGILHDQDAKEKGIVVPFLGLPASSPLGIAKLAARFGSVVLPVHILRLPDGFTHQAIVEPPLEDPSGRPFGEDEELAVRMCNDRISAWILEHPEQWLLWLYPRWASTVPGDR